jgi:hypothetical protein
MFDTRSERKMRYDNQRPDDETNYILPAGDEPGVGQRLDVGERLWSAASSHRDR